MGQGIQLYSPTGKLLFDAENAVGGVCLDIVYIPPSTAGNTVFSFPNSGSGYTGIVKDVLGGAVTGFTYHENGGYPNFVIDSSNAGFCLGLFIK